MKWPFIIVVVAIVAALWGVRRNDTANLHAYAKSVAIENRNSLVDRCNAGIPLRKRINIRTDVLRKLLFTAEVARRSSAKNESSALKAIDLKAADKYRKLRLKLHNEPIPDCEKVIRPIK